jgi:hypothetical protein
MVGPSITSTVCSQPFPCLSFNMIFESMRYIFGLGSSSSPSTHIIINYLIVQVARDRLTFMSYMDIGFCKLLNKD